MALSDQPRKSFNAASGAGATYPQAGTPDGTTTAASSEAITKRVSVLYGVVIESHGSADGTLTIADHAGTASTDIVLSLLTLGTAKSVWFGEAGIEVPWTGISATLTGIAQRVRVIYGYN